MTRLGALQIVVLLMLAACADGYPPKEPSIELNFDMNMEDTLKTMNRIGDHDHRRSQWKYSMEECQLTVRTKELRNRVEPVVIPVDVASVSMQEEESGKRFSVRAAWQADGRLSQQSVLAGASWIDASLMTWMVEHLRRHCASGALWRAQDPTGT